MKQDFTGTINFRFENSLLHQHKNEILPPPMSSSSNAFRNAITADQGDAMRALQHHTSRKETYEWKKLSYKWRQLEKLHELFETQMDMYELEVIQEMDESCTVDEVDLYDLKDAAKDLEADIDHLNRNIKYCDTRIKEYEQHISYLRLVLFNGMYATLQNGKMVFEYLDEIDD